MAELDSQKDIDKGEAGRVKYWLRELSLAGRREKDWRDRAKKIIERYRDERDDSLSDAGKRFGILFSNTQVLHAAVYNKPPAPDVRRRWLTRDPIGKMAATILQRAVDYSLDTPACDADAVFSANTLDALLVGRAVSRVYYRPFFRPGDPVRVALDPIGYDQESAQPQFQKVVEVAGKQVSVNGQVKQDEAGYHVMAPGPDTLVDEMVGVEDVDWEYYRQSPARKWRDVRWVAYGKMLSRDDIRRQFGSEKADAISLDHVEKDASDDSADQMFKRALVWEIWDRTRRKVCVVSDGLKSQYLAEWDDPLQLEGFFPSPRPMQFLKTTTSLIPMPEYMQYQDQALELDDLTQRIDKLTSALKQRGVYDASIDGLQDLANGKDNEYVGISDWAGLQQKGGLAKVFEEMPIDGLAKVLLGLYDAREKVKNDIYEIIGMPDIMRGQSQASETYGAQRIKSESASLRIQPRQSEVARFIRDIIRLMAEIVANHFHPEILSEMSQQQVTPEVMQLLRSDKLRGFAVDIEADSTLKPNMEMEQSNRVQLLQAIGQFAQAIAPAIEGGFIDERVAKGLLTFGIDAFRTGPELESMMDEMNDQEGQQQQPKQPSAAQLKAQQEAQAAQQKAAQDAQDSQQQHQLKAAQLQLEAQRLELEKARLGHEMNVAAMDHQENMAGHETDLMKEAGTVAPMFREIAQMIAQSAQQNAQAMGQLGQFMNRLGELQMQTIAEIRKPKVATSTRTPNGMRAVIQSQESMQ